MTRGLIALFGEVARQDSLVGARGACASIMMNLFTWTCEFSDAGQSYFDALAADKLSAQGNVKPLGRPKR